MYYKKYQNVEPFDFKGLSIKEITPNDLKEVSIAEIEIAPGIIHDKARSTKCDKLYVCKEGIVHFEVNEKNFNLEVNDVLYISKGEWFTYYNDTGKTSKLLLIHIPHFDLDFEEFV